MNKSEKLISILPRKGITIISGLRNNRIDSFVAIYELAQNDTVKVSFPKGHRFQIGQNVTLHLDNRSGVDEYDADLRVYRLSYKGTVTGCDSQFIIIAPDEYMVFYSNECVMKYVSDDFVYDDFNQSIPLPESPANTDDLNWNEREYENKLGVLITKLPSRPHSSLMAFISNKNDDIFLITFKSLFKSKALHFNNHCCFAIDHRAEFVFEKAYDWNYTIIEAKAYGISEDNPLFKEIQYHFVQKNPWEASFFLSPEIEMYHLKPQKILLPETM